MIAVLSDLCLQGVTEPCTITSKTSLTSYCLLNPLMSHKGKKYKLSIDLTNCWAGIVEAKQCARQ